MATVDLGKNVSLQLTDGEELVAKYLLYWKKTTMAYEKCNFVITNKRIVLKSNKIEKALEYASIKSADLKDKCAILSSIWNFFTGNGRNCFHIIMKDDTVMRFAHIFAYEEGAKKPGFISTKADRENFERDQLKKFHDRQRACLAQIKERIG